MFSVLTDRPAERLLRCTFGLFLFGLGISGIVRGDLGLAPWDVLHQGISEQTGIGLGVVIVIVGVLLLLLWIPLGERMGIGTVMNAVLIGVFVELTLPWLPETDGVATRVLYLLAGVVSIGIGSGWYIGAGLGPGPRDGLMTGLAKRGWSIRVARTGVEIAALAIGIVLGGKAGVGTAVFAFGIGPVVQVALPRLSMSAPEPDAIPV